MATPNFQTAIHPRATVRLTGSQWKMIVFASLGGALEFYDFVIYGIFARYIAAAFFPASSSTLSLIITFTVFAIGYLARPIGGAIIGSLGDKHGRRQVFIMSLLIVSLTTVGMGLLPTVSTWGVGATIAMITLRFVQGMCLGGELPGSVVYVVETIPRKAGFVCGVVFFCVQSGVVIASLVNVGVHYFLNTADVAVYGWRIAFLSGGLAGLAGLYLRRSLEETPQFAELERVKSERHPLSEVFTDHWKVMLIGIAVAALTGGFNGIFFGQMPAYLVNTLHLDARSASLAQNISLVTESVLLLVVGWLADRVRPALLMGIGAVLMLTLSYPFYRMLGQTGSGVMMLMLGAGVIAALPNGSFAVIVANLFPTRVRFVGIALTFNVCFAIFSGTAPLIATTLVSVTNDPASPGWFLTGCAFLTLIGSIFVTRTTNHISQHN